MMAGFTREGCLADDVFSHMEFTRRNMCIKTSRNPSIVLCEDPVPCGDEGTAMSR